MNDWVFDLGISVILSAVKNAIKNPDRKEAYKRALLKVRDAINILYLSEE
jgi:hypothetical protein